MTKIEEKNKNMVCRMMYYTARANGKDVDMEHIIRVANRLHRLETTLGRLAEWQCDSAYYNRFWKDGVNPEQERKENLALKIIENEIGCKAYTQRDPRGHMIRMYLVDENGRKWHNSWDGETTGFNW